MASLPSIRCCLNALGSTSRSTRAVQLSRPRQSNLPSLLTRSISQQPPSSSSNDADPETSTGPVVHSPPLPATSPSLLNTQKPIMLTSDFKFSSITTSEALAKVLKVQRTIPPSELALLSALERQQRQGTLNILVKASAMGPKHRAGYFKDVDLSRRHSEGMEQSRRERATKEVERGLWDESDAMSAEEWEEELRTKRESNVEKRASSTGWSREKLVKEAIAQEKRWRRLRLERLEVRRERKKAEREGKGMK